ncbi:transmembrane protein 26-like [Anomaloglossus baeobatrachus]|uniref:transmembrane protein 26-like n=1 Tax=Anomaloglossus baeobatrachus TaxID=238106 RepID=UPI003F4FFAD5
MLCNYRKILSATFSRLFLAVHGGLVVGTVVYLKKDVSYWCFLIGICLFSIEIFITLHHTEHGEWKWFSPMVFLYLCSVIPSIFVMELEYLGYRMNSTQINISVTIDTHLQDDTEYPVSRYVQIEEELTILVLIIGRWLMPRGKMSRDQLAQLLLMYLALGADILDILELMKEPSVKTSKAITVVGLCLFSWAIMQFTLVLTQTVSSASLEREDSDQSDSLSGLHNCIVSLCCSSEVWSVIIAVGMQDGPFLIYRLYLITREGVFNNSMMFFITKNILSVIIQVYRIVVFISYENKKRKTFYP